MNSSIMSGHRSLFPNIYLVVIYLICPSCTPDSILTNYANLPSLLSDSDEDSDEEDDTAELLRELEKIKRERAEEKERLEREQNASQQAERDAEIATSNPLLNLAAALGQGPNNGVGVSTTAPGTFAVKRRWDDGESLFFHSFLQRGLRRCEVHWLCRADGLLPRRCL